MGANGFSRKAVPYPYVKIFGVILGILLVYKVSSMTHDRYKLYTIEQEWHGFGNEKGFYNFTVVTGLFDIGRGSWWTQGRSYNEYLGHMMQILKMDVNVIVFIEPKGEAFVRRIRKGRESKTKVFVTEISDLEYYPLLPRIKEIMASPSFQEDNDNYMKGKCEATDPLYDLVTNSKTSLMHQAVTQNPFGSSYFIWLDGGYGHGDPSIYPSDGIWHPRHLLAHPNQVSFIALRSLPEHKVELSRLHKIDIAWIAGGLFAGGTQAMETFYQLHKEMMSLYMQRGTIDDDQTTFSDCYFKKPEMFRPVQGDWYDLMKPFK